ncbi:hypothetical protein MYX82_02800 [Acidobacteria bacterium AH-259-D05]|nr:hypothetical protein [Acidobacteria bacterium AH-259-D05]
MPKTLLTVSDDEIRQLHTQNPETGMGFQILESDQGHIALFEDGTAIPFYDDEQHYCLTDVLEGQPVPSVRDSMGGVSSQRSLPNRQVAIAALTGAGISPAYTGTAGAVPLVATYIISVDTAFYRYLRTSSDPRFVSGNLTAGTYLTTNLDQTYSNSGFAAVGRYALPIPLPASHVLQYELPSGTTIQVGTVLPMFGQSGGGVEIHLPTAQSAQRTGTSVVPDY